MRTVLVIPSDQQNGSTTGLPPGPKPWKAVGGGKIAPSDEQMLFWRQWVEGWETARDLRKMKRNTRLIVIQNGDAIDGNHHQTTELTTSIPEEQERMHIAAMQKGLSIAGFDPGRDLLYYVEGTEAHAGKGHCNEESIARAMGVVPSAEPGETGQDGRCLWPKLEIDINGVLFQIRHHGGSVGSRSWTKENSMSILAKDIYWRALDFKRQIPNYVIHSHLHRYVHGTYNGRQGTVNTFITPGYQGHTKFINRLAGVIDPPDIGTLMFVIEEDGSVYHKCPRLEYDTESAIVTV